jgi:hypothetical protein
MPLRASDPATRIQKPTNAPSIKPVSTPQPSFSIYWPPELDKVAEPPDSKSLDIPSRAMMAN